MGSMSRSLKLQITAAGAVLFALIAGFFVYTRQYMDEDHLLDVCETLSAQGYQCNTGLSGLYRPGDVVQLIEATLDGGEQRLASPAVFLWGADCFPGQTPNVAAMTLPESSGSKTASLGFSGDKIPGGIVSSMGFNGSASVDFNLKLDNVLVRTLAKGDLSGNLSAHCIKALERQIRSGDKPHWFGVVLESVTADKLLLTIDWKANTSAEAKADIIASTKGRLGNLVESPDDNTALSIEVEHEDTRQTVIETNGTVVLGYRVRPMQRNENTQ
jgi:hypothetical protein